MGVSFKYPKSNSKQCRAVSSGSTLFAKIYVLVCNDDRVNNMSGKDQAQLAHIQPGSLGPVVQS